MRTLLTILATLLCVACSREPEAPEGDSTLTLADYEGDWQGTLEVAGTELPLVLHIDQGDDPAVTLDSPEQGAFGIPASEYGVDEGVLNAAWAELGASYRGRLDPAGPVIEGEFAQGPLTLELVFAPVQTAGATEAVVSPAPPAGRPQEPALPLPYYTEEISIEAEDGTTLGGTLTLPDGDGPFPAVVLLTGSGAQDRDESLLGHKPFLVLSDHLTRQGIATLRFDDRGVGASGGSLDQATLGMLASDAAAKLAYLRSRPEVGTAGIIGHSEGGIVAGMVPAATGTPPDFLVSLAGPFVSMAEIINAQVADGLRRSGASEETIQQTMEIQLALIGAAQASDTPEAGCEAVTEVAEAYGAVQQARQLCSPLAHSWLQVDPAEGFSEFGGPVLALFGSMDLQVPAEMNVPAAKAALADNDDAVVRVVEGANHLFQTAETGEVSEYPSIQETMRPDVMNTVAEFVRLAASD
jgi:pimeloyl-ACP methyl ester carboxylesterase